VGGHTPGTTAGVWGVQTGAKGLPVNGVTGGGGGARAEGQGEGRCAWGVEWEQGRTGAAGAGAWQWSQQGGQGRAGRARRARGWPRGFSPSHISRAGARPRAPGDLCGRRRRRPCRWTTWRTLTWQAPAGQRAPTTGLSLRGDPLPRPTLTPSAQPPAPELRRHPSTPRQCSRGLPWRALNLSLSSSSSSRSRSRDGTGRGRRQ